MHYDQTNSRFSLPQDVDKITINYLGSVHRRSDPQLTTGTFVCLYLEVEMIGTQMKNIFASGQLSYVPSC